MGSHRLRVETAGAAARRWRGEWDGGGRHVQNDALASRAHLVSTGLVEKERERYFHAAAAAGGLDARGIARLAVDREHDVEGLRHGVVLPTHKN